MHHKTLLNMTLCDIALLKWLTRHQVSQITTRSSKALFFFAWRELQLVLKRYFVCYCFVSLKEDDSLVLLFSSSYSLIIWGYSTGVHRLCRTRISLNGIKHGRQFRAGLDLGEEFTQQRTFIWNNKTNSSNSVGRTSTTWWQHPPHTAVKRKTPTPLPVFAALNFAGIWKENLRDFCRKMF